MRETPFLWFEKAVISGEEVALKIVNYVGGRIHETRTWPAEKDELGAMHAVCGKKFK